LAKLRIAVLDGADKAATLEREAGELAAIFASIAMKVASRLNHEAPPKRARK
jgi:hypothetical protein